MLPSLYARVAQCCMFSDEDNAAASVEYDIPYTRDASRVNMHV